MYKVGLHCEWGFFSIGGLNETFLIVHLASRSHEYDKTRCLSSKQSISLRWYHHISDLN